MIIDNIEDSERIDEFLETISENNLENLENLENHEIKNDDPVKKINLLREKTFNVELRSLVNRITENESPGSSDELDNITESELLVKLHRLFYKVKNLHALENINTSFNPFLVDKVEGINIDFLIKSINDDIKSHTLFLELILSFKIEQKCFSVFYENPLSGTDYDIAINLEDKFYKKISGKEKGLILSMSEVSKNPYLKNNFFSLFNDDEEISLYLIPLNRLIKDFSDEWNRNVPDKIFSIFLSKILIFKVNNTTKNNETEIFELLQRKLSIPLFLIDGSEGNIFKLEQYNDINKQINLVECFFQLSVQENSGMGILIRLISPFNKKSQYNFKYLQSKIARIIGKNSIVFRISAGKMLVITDKLKIESVVNSINEYNILFDNFLDIELLYENKEYSVSDLLNHIFIE